MVLAISHCFSEQQPYPDKPFPLRNPDDELPASENQQSAFEDPDAEKKRKAKLNRDLIDSQMIRVSNYFKHK